MKSLTVSFIAIFALVLVGCGQAADVMDETPAARVTAVTVTAETLRPSVELIGTVVSIPERTATLTSQVTGQIGEVCVVEGQTVRKGDPIAILDTRQAEAGRAKAAAAVAEARANLALYERGPLPSEVEAARQDARTAAAAAAGRRAKLKALGALHDRGEIADVQYELAQSALTESAAAEEAAVERLKTMEMGTRPEVIAQAKAQLLAAESELEAQELNVALCRIVSPIDGVVTQLSARLGTAIERVDAIAVVTDLSSVFVHIRIPGSLMMEVTEGAVAEVHCYAAPGISFGGTVTRVGRQADARSGDIDGYVQVENPRGILRGGIMCRVHLALAEKAGALAVPTAAVADRNGRAVVTVVRDGKAYETAVETGTRAGDFIELTSGVSAGEVVATEGDTGCRRVLP